MSLDELNQDQLIELKQAYLMEHQESVSWGELAAADELVSMEELQEDYGHIDFVEEDFTSSAAA